MPFKFLLPACVIGFFALPAIAAPDRYEFDHAHTSILFFISHSGFSDMVGKAKAYEGYFLFDEKHPEEGKVEIRIDPQGIDTGHEGLNKELQTDKFFNTAKYPAITFISREVKVTDAHHAKLRGDFTMLGVTKPLVLDVTLNKAGPHPVSQKYIAGFTASTMLKRSDFGMNFGLPNLLGDDVQIHIETEGTNVSKPDSPSAEKGR